MRLLLILSLLLVSTAARSEERLPTTIRPLRYEMALEVDPATPTFKGRETIPLQLDKDAAVVRLHAQGLTIKNASFSTGNKAEPARVKQQGAMLVLTPARPLKAGQAVLSLEWEGPITTDLAGIYRMQQGKDWYVGTQFEAVDARKLAPCFDEPSFKVPFQLTLTVPDGQTAISNAPVKSERAAKGKRTVVFEETPPLPTYLWAVLVGPFEAVDAGTVGKTPVRIFVPRGKTHLTAYAAQATRKSLAFLEGYFGVPYPYKKLDMIALPEFAAGAMENAGAVTFREERLLLDEKITPVSVKRSVSSIIAHELAHQWFGDLVTMKWWDDLWLNEAFATWMATKTLATTDPAFESRRHGLGFTAYSMFIDSLPGTHPIRLPINSVEEAEGIFDAITYGKGASVLSMLERWLGPEDFQKGMQAYVRKHAFANATADDLYAALSTASGKDVTRVARHWFGAAGHPVLDVTVDCAKKPAVRVSQSRFTMGQPIKAAPWPVPMCVKYPSTGGVKTMCGLIEGEGTLPLDTATCPAWVLPNAESAGFFRYRLPVAQQESLAKAARELAVEERVMLVENAWGLVQHGSLPLDVYLRTLEPLRGEQNRHVLGFMARHLEDIRDTLLDDDQLPAFRALVTSYFGARAAELGWDAKDTDSEDTRELRVALLSAMALTAEDPTHVAAARDRALRWLKDPRSVSADVARVAMASAGRSFTRAEMEAVKAALATADTPERRVVLLSSLGANRDPGLQRAALDGVTGDTVRAQDVQYVVWSAFGERKTAANAWRWVKENHAALVRKLPPSHAARLPQVTGGFCTPEDRKDVQVFFSAPEHVVEAQGPRLREALDAMDTCIALRSRQQAHLRRYLASAGTPARR